MNRTHMTLTGLLLIQALLILLVRSPLSGSGGPVEASALLPALESFSPARLEIRGADDAALTLVRDGESWSLAELDGFPADGEKIGKLLEELSALKVRRPVVSSSRYHVKFKVAENDNEARLRMWGDGDDEPQVDLFVGSSSNFRAAHVRRAGEDPVYEVRGLSPFELRATADNWFDRELVGIPNGELVGLTLSNTHGTIDLERVEGLWVARAPEGDRTLDPTKVDSLISTAGSIQFAEPLASGAARPTADDASATVTLRWIPGGEITAGVDTPGVQEITVLIGDKLPDKETHRSAGRTDSGFAGAVWDSSVSRLLDQKLDELQVATPQS